MITETTTTLNVRIYRDGDTDPYVGPRRALEPGEQLTVRVEGHAAGFVRCCLAGHYRAYSYRRGHGWGPFSNEDEAEKWILAEYATGPIAGYSH